VIILRIIRANSKHGDNALITNCTVLKNEPDETSWILGKVVLLLFRFIL
jgi:hypothetical protein